MSDLKRTFEHVRLAVGLALGVGVVLYLASGLYSIAPDERGVVQRFGRVLDDNVAPGIHYHLPWPVESVTRLETTMIRTVEVRFKTPKEAEERAWQGYVLTGDENMVEGWIKVDFQVKDAARYLFAAEAPEQILSRIIESQTVAVASHRTVEEALVTDKNGLQQELRRTIQATCDRLGLGVHVTSLQLKKIDPPFEVMLSFQDVASAREDRHKLVQRAQGERNRKLPEARAQATADRREAKAFAREKVAVAEGDTRRFTQTLEAFRENRAMGARRLYLEAMERILPRVKRQFIDPDAEREIPGGAL